MSRQLSNHRPREENTWRGEEASSPFLSSCVLDISSFAPPPPSPPQTKQNNNNNKDWRLLRRMIGPTLERWVKARKETGGDGPGAGGTKVCSCYTDSSIMRLKMRKSRHLLKFNGMMQN